MKTDRPIEILMAEDSPSDQAITREAIKHSKMPNRLHMVNDGEEALLFLMQQEKYVDVPLPDLILLDLDMPRLGGRELLAIIKKSEKWKHIPVVILTASARESDVADAYRLQANCYVVKPVDFSRYAEIVRTIEEFWTSIVRLPTAWPKMT